MITNPDTTVCKNDSTIFTVNNNQTPTSTTYTWNVAGLPTFTTTNKVYRVNASILGTFATNSVIINNGPAYCPDTVYLGQSLTVKGFSLNFTNI